MAVAIVSHSTPQLGTTQTMAINVPASIAAGGIIAFYGTHGGILDAMPAGVTLEHNSNAQFIAWISTDDHIAGGSPASYTFGVTSVFSDLLYGHAIQFSGCDDVDPFDGAVQTGTTVAVTTGASLTVTTAEDASMLIYNDYKTALRTLNTSPDGMTALVGLPADTKAGHHFSMIQATAGASTAKQVITTPASSHWSMLYAVKEPGAAPPPPGDTVVVDGVLKTVTERSVIVDGVKKSVTNLSVIVNGNKKPIP